MPVKNVFVKTNMEIGLFGALDRLISIEAHNNLSQTWHIWLVGSVKVSKALVSTGLM
jgi:hypothetical protein